MPRPAPVTIATRSCNLMLVTSLARLGPLNADRLDVDGVNRGVGAHEEAVSQRSAEHNVGADLRRVDFPDQVAARSDAMHAVGSAAPYISFGVEPEAVRDFGRDLDEDPALRSATLVGDVEDADVVRAVGIGEEPGNSTM